MKKQGILAEVIEEIVNIMNNYGLARRIAKVSAIKRTGLNELYDLLHEIYCTCEDLT